VETRDILNYLGAVVGQLTLPSDTSEEAWATALAPYALPPLTAQQLYILRVEAQQKKAPSVISQIRYKFSTYFTTVAEASVFYTSYLPAVVALREGAFQTAIYLLQNSVPTGPVTQDMLNEIMAIILENSEV